MSRRTGPDAATRALVLARDGGSCVICGSTQNLQIHHRAGRRMGGTRRPEINSPANLLTLDLECHQSVESRRRDALDRGLLLPQSVEDPSAWPVCWHGQVVLLTHDGQALPVTDPWDAA